MRVARTVALRRRRSWRDVEFVSLDFEATGLDFATRRDRVVRRGPREGRARRRSPTRCISSSIPTSRRPCPRSRCTSSGRRTWRAPRLDQARLALREAIRGRYLLVWYADVEVNFLSAIFGRSAARWRRRTIDVRNLAIEADGAPSSARTDFGYGLTSTAGRLGVRSRIRTRRWTTRWSRRRRSSCSPHGCLGG